MEGLFLSLANMSITASWVILAVVILRLLLKRAPKWIACIMWVPVAIRLVLPISFESFLSLIPSSNTLTERDFFDASPTIHTGVSSLNSVVNPMLSDAFAADALMSANPLQIYTFMAAIIWVIGMAAMLIYATASYIRLSLRVRESVVLYDNVRICDRIPSPFILGVIRPKIYLPSDIDDGDTEYVLMHERAHIKRLDHIWKPLGFLVLTVHWFNPAVWLAYILLCRDIEGAADQKVIARLGDSGKKPYSEALINCAAERKMISACPLAFGESGIKGRISSVLSFKKPTVWVLIAAAIGAVCLAVCFLTDPYSVKGVINRKSSGSHGVSVNVVGAELSGISPYIELEWKNNTEKDVSYGERIYIYKKDGGEWTDCRIGDFVWSDIGYNLGVGMSTTKRYYLTYYDMASTGKYRIEVPFSFENDDVSYGCAAEFELTEPVEIMNVHTFEVEELTYSCGMFSFVPDAEGVKGERFRLVNGMALQKLNTDTIAQEIGVFEEITLSNRKFKSRITDGDFSDIKHIQNGNKRAWEIYTEEGGDLHALYMLLEQKNGDFYLCYGYYNMQHETPINDDSSMIRFIYKLKRVQPTGGTAAEELSETKMFDQYTYQADGDPIARSICLYYDGTFSFTFHPLSSYFAVGQYSFLGNTLLLRTNDGEYTYLFNVAGDTLIFDESASSEIPSYDGIVGVPDRAVFEKSKKAEDYERR